MSDEPPASDSQEQRGAADLERELERLHPLSFGWALACCGYDPDTASEVLQAAYLKVLDRKARFHGRSSVKTWFFAVVRTTAADRRRRSWTRALRLGRLSARAERADVPAQPLELVEQSERRERLLAALRALPGRQRQVLELVFYQGLTIEEAAGVMAVSVGTARVHYERGKKKMLALLAGELR